VRNAPQLVRVADRIAHATAHFPADQDHTNVEENNRSAAIAGVRKHIRTSATDSDLLLDY
jgi:hypothetical protein